MGRSPARATVVLVLALGTALAEGTQVTPACVDSDCDEPQEGRSILQVKSLDRTAAQAPADVFEEEEGVDTSQVKPHQAALKMQGAGGGRKKKTIKGKVLLQTDTSALSRGGPVEEDTREDFRRVPPHIPVRVPDTMAVREEVVSSVKTGEAISQAKEQDIVGSISRAEEIGLQDNHQSAGKKGRKPVKANSLVQMANTKSKAQLHDEEEEEEEEEEQFADNLHISAEEEKHIMRRIAQARARGVTLASNGVTTDRIKEMVRSAAVLQETVTAPKLQMLHQGKHVNISGSDDATHGHSGQTMLDAIAAAAEDELSEAEQRASQEAASQERMLPPTAFAQASLLQKKSGPAMARNIRNEDPRRPSTGDKDLASEQEEAVNKPAAWKGEMRKPAKGKSLVQMTKGKHKAQLHEEDKAHTEADRSASNAHISAEEEKDIIARIARAKAQGTIHRNNDLSEESIKEIVKSAALFQQLTHSVSNAQEKEQARQDNDPDISGTEDAAHGHSAQGMLDEIAAAEEEKLSEAEQKASEDAASQERLLPPNQTALMQKKSRPAMASKIRTEDPQEPNTNGKDFYDWVAEQEGAESHKGAKKGEMRKPAKGKSLVQVTDKKYKARLHEEDTARTEEEEGRFASNLHITVAEEQAIMARIARAKAQGAIHPSKDLTEESIKEIVKSAAFFQQLTPSLSTAQEKEQVRQVSDPDISGTEDAAHGHSAQDMLDAIAATEEEKLSEAEQKASEEAASQERLLPPNQTALMQKKSRPATAAKILTEEPQRLSTNGKDFYDWVGEQEEAEVQSAVRKGQMDKPAKGSSLVQTNTKYKSTQLHEEEEDEGGQFATNLHISTEEEQHILARIARAKAKGAIHPSKDLTEAKIQEIVKSAALLHQGTPSISKEHMRQVNNPDISGTEDAAHGHSAQDMLDAIAATEEQKLSEAEQEASEEASSQERLLPPNQTTLVQKKSRRAMTTKILTEEPQKPSTNGKDFYDWVATQEEE